MSIKNFFGSITNIEKEVIVKSSPTIGSKKKASSNEDNNEDKVITKKFKINSQSDEKLIENDDITTWIPFDSLDKTWANLLRNETIKPYYKKLDSFLVTETKKHTVYPIRENIFTAFNLCSFDNVKVVIIGQDPYHGKSIYLSNSISLILSY
jgi:hypothetical protein